MNVLALNCGSSTVKFRLVAVEPGAAAADGRELARGSQTVHGEDYAAASGAALAAARAAGAIEAVGHRVVHGGVRFTTPAPIGDALRDLRHARPAVDAGGAEVVVHPRPLHARRDAGVVLTAVGAYQLLDVLRASERLAARAIARSVVAMLEPDRFRAPRDAREAAHAAPAALTRRLYPDGVRPACS